MPYEGQAIKKSLRQQTERLLPGGTVCWAGTRCKHRFRAMINSS